jgi:hypothetical protein
MVYNKRDMHHERQQHKKEKKRKTKQAAKYSLHHLRKKRHIGPKCCESPPPTQDTSVTNHAQTQHSTAMQDMVVANQSRTC